MYDSYDSNTEYDSDRGAGSGEPSILKPGEITPEDRRHAALIGFIPGFLISLVVAGITLLVVLIQLDEKIGEWTEPIIWGGAILLGVGSLIGMLVRLSNLNLERSEGFLRVDNETVEYWTSRGIVTVPLSEVFGAGPEKGTFSEYLRICFLSGDERGFAFLKRNFKRYEAVSGPGAKLGYYDADGNTIARETIAHHVNMRRDAGLPVAELPPYRYEAIQAHKQKLLYGETVVDAIFECDGVTVNYQHKDNHHKFPVKAVEKIKRTEARSQYGRTAYYLTLTLDPSYGEEKLKIDLMHMPKPEEIDKYCHCLPTVLPVKETSGYWE